MAYYYRHPNLVLPDDNSVIWRYMDFPKFESMLQRGSIFFSRADKQTDHLEGEYPNDMLDELNKRWGIIRSDDKASYTFMQWHAQKEIPSRLLSCWSVGLNESRKMWSAYTTTVESVAIHSTIERLKSCFNLRGNGEPVVWIGKIRYGNEESRLPHSFHKWNVNYFLYPFFAKKEEFRWENEVRATVNISRKKQLSLDHNPSGCFIKADLHALIDSVWVHPQAEEDFRHRVESMFVDSEFGEIPICQSSWESVSG
jgi:hypothetical protein